MNKQRPVNLNLFTIKFPVPAIVSILHRVTGILVLLALPFLLWLLSGSLRSADDFADMQSTLANPLVKLILWAVISALLFHIVAGLRHLVMDLGYGETLQAGRVTARAVMVVSIILAILLGWWLW